MEQKMIKNLLAFKNKYGNKWVAKDIDTDKVVGSAKTLSALVIFLKKKKVENYRTEKVLPPNVAFIS